MAHEGLSACPRRPLLSSIEDSIVSTIIDWFLRQSFFGGQKTSMAVGIHPCGVPSKSAGAE
jgi:hypothetical protein